MEEALPRREYDAAQKRNDARLERLENQHDEMTKQTNALALSIAEGVGLMRAGNQKIDNLSDNINGYIEAHNREHNDLRENDRRQWDAQGKMKDDQSRINDDIRRYVYIAIGVVGVISFLAPYIWDVLFRKHI